MTFTLRKNLTRPLTRAELDGNFEEVTQMVASANSAITEATAKANEAAVSADGAASAASSAASSASAAAASAAPAVDLITDGDPAKALGAVPFDGALPYTAGSAGLALAKVEALDYADGVPLTVSHSTQVVRREDDVYRVILPASFPVVLSGTWASDSPLLTATDAGLRGDLTATTGAEEVGRQNGTLEDTLDFHGVNGVAGTPLRAKNTADVAQYGSDLLPDLTDPGYTLSNFTTGGVHAAGTVGTISIDTPLTAWTRYKLTIDVTTTATGFIRFSLDGVNIHNDSSVGYHFSTRTPLTVGMEQSFELSPTLYTFSVFVENRVDPSGFELLTDTAWQGTIGEITLQEVTEETSFVVKGEAAVDNIQGPASELPQGLKVGRNFFGVLALGDRETLGLIQQGVEPPTAGYGYGGFNLAFGARALASVEYGDQNTGVGVFALQWNEGSKNSAFGYSALKYNTKGQENTAGGYKCLTSNSIGYRNTGWGFWALALNKDGNGNTATGRYCGLQLTGDANSYYGHLAGRVNGIGGTGNNNCFFGAQSGDASSATSYSDMTAVGVGTKVFGSGCISLGRAAYAGGNESTPLADAISIGMNAEATAAQTVVIGGSADGKATGIVSVGFGSGVGLTGTYNTNLGYQAGVQVAAFSGCTNLGRLSVVTGSNQVQLGTSGTTTYAYGAVQDRSDIRDKADIEETALGIDFIMGLRAVDGRWDMRDDYRLQYPMEPVKPLNPEGAEQALDDKGGPTAAELTKYEEEMREYTSDYNAWEKECARVTKHNKKLFSSEMRDGSKKRSRRHQWFIAQEVAELCERLGVDFGGLQHHAKNGGDDVYSLGYAEFTPPIVKAVQQCWARLDGIEKRLKALES